MIIGVDKKIDSPFGRRKDIACMQILKFFLHPLNFLPFYSSVPDGVSILAVQLGTPCTAT